MSKGRHSINLPTEFVRDSAFPFKPLEELVARIDGKNACNQIGFQCCLLWRPSKCICIGELSRHDSTSSSLLRDTIAHLLVPSPKSLWSERSEVLKRFFRANGIRFASGVWDEPEAVPISCTQDNTGSAHAY